MTSLIPSPAVSLVNGRPAITSMLVAEYFGKNHQHVLRDIRRVISECEGVSNFGQTPLFEETTYTDEQNGQDYPMFIIYRDGFMLLVMGYTGKKALQIKLVFIAAFNAMEAELARRGEQPALTCPDAPITPDQQKTLQDIVRAKVEALPQSERHGGLYPQIWTRFKNHFRVPRYTELPQSRMSEAVAYLMHMELRQKAITPSESSVLSRMAAEHLATLRKLGFEFGAVSDKLFGIFVRDEVVQSLRLATVLSINALVQHFADLAARE